MAHLVETMAYAGQTPWHGLGKEVSNDLTPEEMLIAADLNWTVDKKKMFLNLGKGLKEVEGEKALVRSKDDKVLSIVSDTWNPVQNSEAFEFFNDFVLSGNMEMHTAGSLKDGKMVWALARVKESFSVFGGDEVDSYLLFSNPHEFGKSIDVRFTPIRVVCNNTLTYALSTKVKNQIKLNHCRKFNGDAVKAALGFSHERLEMYKQQALFLGSKRYTKETIHEYFTKLFPKASNKKENKEARNVSIAMELLDKQPGAEFAEGTFWQAFNTVTYMVDHVIGRNADTRLSSSWYGAGAKQKMEALDLALNMAEAA